MINIDKYFQNFVDQERHYYQKVKYKSKNLRLKSQVACSCCGRNNKLIFNSENPYCSECKMFYRRHCLFFGFRLTNTNRRRFELCHKIMSNHQMTFEIIPKPHRDLFENELDKGFYKRENKLFCWECKICNFIAKTPYDLFCNKSCLSKQDHFLRKINISLD